MPTIDRKFVDRLENFTTALDKIVQLLNEDLKKENDLVFSEQYACTKCGISYTEVEPRIFSFNSPYGACLECNGLGIKLEFDPELVIPDRDKSINEGAIEAWKKGGKGYIMYYRWLIRELSYVVLKESYFFVSAETLFFPAFGFRSGLRVEVALLSSVFFGKIIT